MQQYLGVIIGVVVGVAGAVLFMQSMPPDEGSETERAEKAEQALRRVERENRALQASGRRAGPGRTTRDGAREILDQFKSEGVVDLDNVFQMTKPWMRDLSPVLNRIRIKSQTEMFDHEAGAITEKYNLSERQEKELRKWFTQKAEENSAKWDAIIESDSTDLMDLFRAGRDAEENMAGIDEFMESQLTGEALRRYKDDRREERIASVQHEANGKLNRLDDLVDLDASQEDELFLLMARGSRDYVPSMEIEGMTGDRSQIEPENRTALIRSVLRPEQLEIFEAERERRRLLVEEDFREVGLRLPDNWDLMDEYDW